MQQLCRAASIPLGIDFISVLGMPPVRFVELAARLECRWITLAPTPFLNPLGCPAWSLRDDPALRRDVISALEGNGVSVAVGEGFIARPEVDVREAALDLDLMRVVGAERVNLVSIDPDLERARDQCALFAEMASARDMDATLEFMPGPAVGNLSTALDVIQHSGNPRFRLLVDAMHFVRSGSAPDELAGVDPNRIGYFQLCDAPLVSRHESYGYEASFERLPPGAGELPLSELLAHLPAGIPIGLEVPMLKKARDGIGPIERLSECVTAARELLANMSRPKRADR